MTKDRYVVFVPELVPLHNKGEEAIVRGYADMIFPDGNVSIHVLDRYANEPYERDGIFVHPAKWFCDPWRNAEFRLGFSSHEIRGSFAAALRYILSAHLYPTWVLRTPRIVRRLERNMARVRATGSANTLEERSLSTLMNCDYILAGHDGGFNESTCHILAAFMKIGKSFGLLGAGMSANPKYIGLHELLRRTLRKADFIYFRDRFTAEWVRKYLGELQAEVMPDPAFIMRPSSSNSADKIIDREGIKALFVRPVVMVTPAEPALMARHCFSETGSPYQRLDMHREALARVADHAIENHDANVLFLPHTIGHTPDTDDRSLGKRVVAKMRSNRDRVRVLEGDYSARDMKALIEKAAFLVG